jgi:outer membrane lipoprotein-sorting protein
MFRIGLLAATVALAQVPASSLPDARTLIAESAVATKKYKSYQMDSVVTVDVRGGNMDAHLEMPSSVKVRRPDRMRIESRSQAGNITIVSDGEQTWFYLSAVHRYVKRDAVAASEMAVGGSGLLPKNLLDLDQSIKSIKVTGEEAIKIAGKAYPCWVVETSYGEILMPERNLTIRNAVLTNWVTKAERLSVQSMVSGDIVMGNVAEPVLLTQSMRTTALKLDAVLPDAEFAFSPPADATQASDWSLPGIGKPDVEGKPAPDFKAKALDGSAIDLSAMRGKPVLLHIGADWCVPSRREEPLLEKLQTDFPGIAVVGVTIGPAPSAKPAFPVAAVEESDALLAALSINSLPTTVLIDADGKVAAYLAGAQDDAALRKELAKLAGAAASK